MKTYFRRIISKFANTVYIINTFCVRMVLILKKYSIIRIIRPKEVRNSKICKLINYMKDIAFNSQLWYRINSILYLFRKSLVIMEKCLEMNPNLIPHSVDLNWYIIWQRQLCYLLFSIYKSILL